MLFRAVFWIGLVALLMPHEPDLGYGRPHATASLPAEATNWFKKEVQAHPDLCADHRAACDVGTNVFAGIQSLAWRSLGQVKTEIEASQRQRLIGTHAI